MKVSKQKAIYLSFLLSISFNSCGNGKILWAPLFSQNNVRIYTEEEIKQIDSYDTIKTNIAPDISSTPIPNPKPSVEVPVENSENSNVKISGNIFDENNTRVENVRVSVKPLNNKTTEWQGETINVNNGYYSFQVPSGIEVEISVSDGITEQKRIEGISYSKYEIFFNFKDKYALKIKPVISRIKVNDYILLPIEEKEIEANQYPSKTLANGNSDSSEIHLEFTFNKPVDRKSIEKSLQIIYQNYPELNNTDIQKTIFDNYDGLSLYSYSWKSDSKSFTVTARSKSNSEGSTAYKIMFNGSFKDIGATESDNNKSIKFSQDDLRSHFVFN